MSLRLLLDRSRPRFWLYLAGPVLVGAIYGASQPADLVSPVVVVLFAYFLLPGNLFLYGVNDVFDADVDRTNPKKAGRERRYRGDRLTWVSVIASALLGLALVPALPPQAVPWIVGFLVLGAAYSVPPIRLKIRPPFDTLSNGLYILPGAAAYAALAGTAPPLLAVAGGWLWTMAMHTFSAIPDVEPDRRAGIRTMATVLGTRYASVYTGLTWFLAAGVFAVLDLRLGAIFLVYPLLSAVIGLADVPIDRAYWWYPAINAAAGMALTFGGLWGLFYG